MSTRWRAPAVLANEVCKLLTDSRTAFAQSLNRWISHDGFRVYLRVGTRVLDGKRRRMLTVANVSVPPTKMQQGHFASFMIQVEGLVHDFPDVECLCVENVQSPRLDSILKRQSWCSRLEHGTDLCFYKELKRQAATEPQ